MTEHHREHQLTCHNQTDPVRSINSSEAPPPFTLPVGRKNPPYLARPTLPLNTFPGNSQLLAGSFMREQYSV